MIIIDKKEQQTYALSSSEIKLPQLKSLTSDLSKKIISLLAVEPSYPSKIARELGVHEQVIFYHIRKLEKAHIIKILKREDKQGGVANYYSLCDDSFFVKFKDFKPTEKISYADKKKEDFLKPFIEGGQFNALIVVGSPEPHGTQKARSKDGHYGIDLALFFGTFLNYTPKMNVKLDTEIDSADLKNNLILIGGPVVNKITEKVNDNLLVHFDPKFKRNIRSSLTKQVYLADNCGMIVKAKNPFNQERFILVIAGKRFSGTKAAVISFLTKFDEIVEGNRKNKKILAKVVEGFDSDSDGVVDSVEFLE